MEKSKKYLSALEIYKMLAKEFRRAFSEGLQKIGSQAYKAQRRMEKDKKIKREIKAEKLFEKAKKYAKSKKISLSRLIESYLASLTSGKGIEIDITPLVESLSVVINLPEDFDQKESDTDYLMEKYK